MVSRKIRKQCLSRIGRWKCFHPTSCHTMRVVSTHSSAHTPSHPQHFLFSCINEKYGWPTRRFVVANKFHDPQNVEKALNCQSAHFSVHFWKQLTIVLQSHFDLQSLPFTCFRCSESKRAQFFWFVRRFGPNWVPLSSPPFVSRFEQLHHDFYPIVFPRHLFVTKRRALKSLTHGRTSQYTSPETSLTISHTSTPEMRRMLK